LVPSVISHYEILEKIGEGGMGVVYKARDRKLERLVAVKFLSTHLAASAESKARFVQEARAAAALNHPNILAVYDIDEQDGSMFFVMEFIEGKTIKTHLASLKASEGIPVRQAFDWTIQVAQGLKAAHGKGIIHRDIKPENIMLTSDGLPKIMDFGISKLKGGTGLTQANASLGTLSYMSPEQAQGKLADSRSDIWSLGVTMYEMLTSELPFRAEHEVGLQYLIMNEQPQEPSHLDRRVPALVDSVVMKMLEKDPAARYQNMDECLTALIDVHAEMARASQTGKTKTIAVLPFTNMSADPENEYFSDGLTEEIIAHLSRLKDVKVIARTTSMQYKATKKDIKTIGRELGARYIMEGSVRKFQNDLRITAQLIDVEDATQLWAETYKGKLADIFDFQEHVSKQILDALMVKLTPAEKIVLTKRSTESPEAFDCNLRARNFLYLRTKTSIQLAIDLFKKAIALDIRYAAAYAGLGEAYATVYRDMDRQETLLDQALEASLKALMYDASLSEAYATLGLAYFGKKALSESLTAAEKAIELDPNNFNAYWILSRIYHTTDRDKEAVAALEKAIKVNPEFYTGYDDLEMYYERLGDQEKLDETIRKVLKLYPGYIAQHPDDLYKRMSYAVALIKVDRLDEARAAGAEVMELSGNDPIMMYYGACLYARLMEKKVAVGWLKKAIAAGYSNYDWIRRDPDLDNLHDDPDYIELMTGK
jgi:serine/threonine protein kinase/tetratricopeptide (TPR) repeat protein